MYSRDFGGIKSDGQLYNYEREYNDYNQSARYDRDKEGNYPPEKQSEHETERKRGLSLDFLRDLRADDLILIGIGLLILLDSDGENDIFALLIAFLLFF